MIKLILASLLIALPILADQPDPDPARFAKDIEAFDAQDKANPPTKGGIVFTGSSSIRLLDIPKYFPDLKALNRGFGGSQISDLNHYLERCVLRYEPSIVVFYCGTNDVWEKKSPDQVEKDYNEFTKRLFQRCPKAKLIVLAARPSPSRKSIRAKEVELNNRFAKSAQADERITYVPGAYDRYLDKTGKCIPSLFVEDQLHMSPAGYDIWKEILTPLLPAKR